MHVLVAREQVGEERVCFILQFIVYHPGKLGQEFTAGGRSKCRGQGAVLRTGLLLMIFSACLLQHPRPLSRVWPHPHWAVPSHIHHHSRECITALPTGQSGGSISLTESLSSKMARCWVKSNPQDQCLSSMWQHVCRAPSSG